MERGRASAGLAPSPQAPGCDPQPHSPASLQPSSSAFGPSRSLSLYLLHREAGGGVLTHMEAGGPVGPSPAPHPPRQGNHSSGSPSEKQQGRAGLGGPDVEPPAPPDSLPRGQWQRSWGHLGPRGPRPGWSSEVNWFWVRSNSRLRDVSWVSQLQGEAPGWCLEAGTPAPHVRARLALRVQTVRGQEGLAAVLTVPKTPTEDCPHALKCLEIEARPQLPHLKSGPSDPLPDLHRSELGSGIMSRTTQGACRPHSGAPQLPHDHSHPAPPEQPREPPTPPDTHRQARGTRGANRAGRTGDTLKGAEMRSSSPG